MRSLKLSLLALFAAAVALPIAFAQSVTEAPAGFDDVTNGFTTQEQFDADRDVFDEDEFKADGASDSIIMISAALGYEY